MAISACTTRGAPRRVARTASLAAAAGFLAATSFAQGSVQQMPGPMTLTPVSIERSRDDALAEIDIPQPPRAVLNEPVAPIGDLPTIPVGASDVPQPDSLETRVFEPADLQPLAGQFRFFRNERMVPSGAGLLHPGEPAMAHNRDVYFGTGNTYATLSLDSGKTFSYVNPYTKFSAVDGGVCCDQRVIHVPGTDITIWYIQYRYSATTQRGGVRIAVAKGRNGLRSNSWVSAYYTPQSFNQPLTYWLDFPDVAVSGQWAYFTSNVFQRTTSGDSYRNSVVWRIRLADLANNGFGGQYYLRSGGSGPLGGGASYRFTQTYNGVRSPTMFFASHNSTASLRIFAWRDSSTNSARDADVDRAVAAWTSGAGTSPGPDGRDWIGFDDHRIASGYVSGTEGGFLWTSRNSGTVRPQSFVRVCRFRTSDRVILANDDVWSSSIDFAYPACGVNSLGHKGVVMSGGSATTHVTTFAFLVDNYSPGWFGQTIFAMANGTHGAPSNRWGDYHTVAANRIDTRTFNGTGMRMSGGTSTPNTDHRHVWFGRDDYQPTWVRLTVSSAPITGVPITVGETDVNGLRDGATTFVRSYTPGQGYTLTAPATRTSGSSVYAFVNWTGSGGTQTSPTYTVTDIGAIDDTATANYARATSVFVRSLNPSSGIRIAHTADVLGTTATTTAATAYFLPNRTATFVAPATNGSLPFREWLVGSSRVTGSTTLQISVGAADVTVTAVYRQQVHGSFRILGAGCRGTNGIPALGASAPGGTPDVGERATYSLSGGPATSLVALAIGDSNTAFGFLPLPFDLALIGAPGCFVYNNHLLTLNRQTSSTGTASAAFDWPNVAAFIGAAFYQQWICVDPRANAFGLTTSNYCTTTLGGIR